ncbi:MAG: nucleoside phosphorylase [Bacteroidales bacterium]
MADRTQIIFQPDGSVFHIGRKPGEIARIVLLVGDPGRVDQIKKFMDSVENERKNREFHSFTGTYRQLKITTLSTGIGTDNIDIVLNELDLLANYDRKNRRFFEEQQQLILIRIGTSGSIQEDLPPGTFVVSSHAVGTDGLLYYYKGGKKIMQEDFTGSFISEVGWPAELAHPYLVPADEALFSMLKDSNSAAGITISANGFYGPQGRSVRIPVAREYVLESLAAYRYREQRIVNFEMETSAIFGLSLLMGHRAATICAIIANRMTGEFLSDYKPVVDRMIEHTLNQLHNHFTP